MSPFSPQINAAPDRGAKPASLEKKIFKDLIDQAAGGIEAVLITDPNEERDEMHRVLRSQGYESDIAKKEIIDRQNEGVPYTIGPSPTGSCLVVLPKVLDDWKLGPIQKLFEDAKLGALFQKFIALHEGAHCQQDRILTQFGMDRTPISELAKISQGVVKETFSDMYAGAYLLRAAYQSGDSQQISNARGLIKTIADDRAIPSPHPHYQLCKRTLEFLLGVDPQKLMIANSEIENQIMNVLKETIPKMFPEIYGLPATEESKIRISSYAPK